MLARLRDILHQRELKRYPATNIHLTGEDHFSKLRSIGIVFDAMDEIEPVMAFKKHLQKDDFEVNLMGFFNTREDPGVQRFNYFSSSNLNFRRVPTSEIALRFIETPFDVLFNLDTGNHQALTYVSAASAALFKVGPAGKGVDHYDLMIELSDGGGVGQFIDEIRRTINAIS